MGSSCLGDSLILSLFFLLHSFPKFSPVAPVFPFAALYSPSVPPLAGDTQNAACVGQLKPAAVARKSEGTKPCDWEGKKKAEETAFSESVLPIVLFLNQTDMMMMTMTTE